MAEEKIVEKQDLTSRLRNNLWIVSTVILGVICLALLFLVFNNGITGNVIGKGEAGEKLVSYLNGQVPSGEVILSSVEEESGLYRVTVDYQGDAIPLYMTKDGNNFISQLQPITDQATQQTQQQEEITKVEMPVFEAFVSPYCPYGLQYMKGLIPVYDLLKDKADINIMHMGITHMQEEEPETNTRLCILEEYGKEKFFDYVREIVYSEEGQECYNVYHGINLQTNEQIDSPNAGSAEYFGECMDQVIESAFNKAGMNEETIENCVERKGDQLYSESVSYAGSKSVSGSPTPIINNVKVSGGRSPEAIKQVVCSGFTEESKPEECSQELSTETPSPGISPLSESSAGAATGAC